VNLSTKEHKFLTIDIPWDVEGFDLSRDGKRIAFVTNEAGLSVLRELDTAEKGAARKLETPIGVIGAIRWNANGRDSDFR